MASDNPASFYGFFPGEEAVEKFVERLEIFCSQNKVIDDVEKVKFLVSSVGTRTYGALKKLLSPAKPKPRYQDLVRAMLRHYAEEKNEMTERFAFWKRDQQANESIMDYITVLKRLAETCNFASYLDQALRDRFVFGLHDKDIQAALIDTKKLTFKKACTVAQKINIKACLTSEKLSEPDLCKYQDYVPRKRRALIHSKMPSRTGGKFVRDPSPPIVLSLSPDRIEVDVDVHSVKSEPADESGTVGNDKDVQGEFAFEQITCADYTAEETEEPSKSPRSNVHDALSLSPAAPATPATPPRSAPATPERDQDFIDSLQAVSAHLSDSEPEPRDGRDLPPPAARPYTCDLCQKSFASQRNLARHRAAHSGARNYACALCDKSYTQASSLKAHMSCHTGERVFNCGFCAKTFKYRSNLRVHLDTHDGGGGGGVGFPCRLCAKSYRGRRSLVRHLATHGEEGAAIVGEIDRRGRERREGAAVAAAGGRPLKECQVCHKEFPSAYLRAHMSVHTGDRRYVCDVCGKAFAQCGSLKAHAASHSDARPFACDVCGKSFALKAKLKLHVRVHGDERRYICETCGKGFMTNGVLKTHLLSHGERTFKCTACGKAFKTKVALRYHLKLHTGVSTKRFTCEFCGQQFVHGVTLKAHTLKVHSLTDMRQRQYKCTLCDSAFFQHSHLKSHLFVHTKERRFACHLCDRAFALRGNLVGHMVVHTGERRFQCDVCPKAFTLKRNLKSHVAKSHGGGDGEPLALCVQQC